MDEQDRTDCWYFITILVILYYLLLHPPQIP